MYSFIIDLFIHSMWRSVNTPLNLERIAAMEAAMDMSNTGNMGHPGNFGSNVHPIEQTYF